MLFKWQSLRRFFIKIRGVSESVISVSALRPKMFYFKSGAFRIKIEILYDFSVACTATTFDA